MSLSTAIELNDIVCSMLDMGASSSPGVQGQHGGGLSPPHSYSCNDEQHQHQHQQLLALDSRDICRTAIAHLQASVRAEAEAERRAVAAMQRDVNMNVNMGTAAAAEGEGASLLINPSAIPATASSSSSTSSSFSSLVSSTPSTPIGGIDDGDQNRSTSNTNNGPPAEVLRARSRLELARQMAQSHYSGVPNESDNGAAFASLADTTTTPTSNAFRTTNSASSNQRPAATTESTLRRLYTRPIKVGGTCIDICSSSSAGSATAATTAVTTTTSTATATSTTTRPASPHHQHPTGRLTTIMGQSESISGIVLYNFALCHQMLGVQHLATTTTNACSTGSGGGGTNHNDDADDDDTCNDNARDEDERRSSSAATTVAATAHLRKACALYDMSLRVLEAELIRQIQTAEVRERSARNPRHNRGNGNGNGNGHVSSSSNNNTVRTGTTNGDYHIANQVMDTSAPTSGEAATEAASMPNVDSPLQQLTLLCAAACLHNSATLLAHMKSGDDDIDGDGDEDILTRSTSVLTLCNVQRTLTLLPRRGPLPPINSSTNMRGTHAGGGKDTTMIEEAWDLFFFSALSIPLVEMANAA